MKRRRVSTVYVYNFFIFIPEEFGQMKTLNKMV